MIAVATPTIFPVPTVAASAVQSAFETVNVAVAFISGKENQPKSLWQLDHLEKPETDSQIYAGSYQKNKEPRSRQSHQFGLTSQAFAFTPTLKNFRTPGHDGTI